MWTINLQSLKNTIKVAKHTGKEESFNAKHTDKHRDIKIEVTYYPNTKSWKIYMEEEEDNRNVFLDGNALHEVRDIFNGFMKQGIGESYLNAEIIPY